MDTADMRSLAKRQGTIEEQFDDHTRSSKLLLEAADEIDQLREVIKRVDALETVAMYDGRETYLMYDSDEVRNALWAKPTGRDERWEHCLSTSDHSEHVWGRRRCPGFTSGDQAQDVDPHPLHAAFENLRRNGLGDSIVITDEMIAESKKQMEEEHAAGD